MFLLDMMKKLLIVIPILLLFVASLFLYWKFNYPSAETIKREVKELNPKAKVVSSEMIFDWEPKRIVTYIVKYKEPPNNEVWLYDFSLKQDWNFQWHWCNDQTERKCD